MRNMTVEVFGKGVDAGHNVEQKLCDIIQLFSSDVTFYPYGFPLTSALGRVEHMGVYVAQKSDVLNGVVVPIALILALLETPMKASLQQRTVEISVNGYAFVLSLATWDSLRKITETAITNASNGVRVNFNPQEAEIWKPPCAFHLTNQ